MVDHVEGRRSGSVFSSRVWGWVLIAAACFVSLACVACGDNERYVCGDGLRETGERCDDGNLADGDGCDSNCTPTGCDNGVITAGEACDDGNLIDGDGCDNNCTSSACGNGVVTAGEACDDGNATNGDGCDANCTPSTCGNGAVAPGEGCDDGNRIDGDGCDSNCRPTGCGNGIVTASEECDDANDIDTDDCRNSCKTATCGDGVAATGATGARREDCDGAPLDGTAPVETATCNLDCTEQVCGDGKVNHTAGEECDDSNASDLDDCTTTCRAAVCGDGFLRGTSPAEQCDDGNTVTEVCDYGAPSCTVCDASCAVTPGETSACGDGIAQAPFEVCDDGNAVNGDWCDAGCMGISLAPSTYVKASNTQLGDRFGRVIALSADGSTLAVGSPYEDCVSTGINGDQNDFWDGYGAGAVYVFVRSGATWVQQAYIKESNSVYYNHTSSYFGSSLALSADGSTLAVGTEGEAGGATGIDGDRSGPLALRSGAAYVFVRSGTTWSQQAYIKASNTGRDDNFGASIALSADGSTLAVGAPGEDSAATGINGNQASNSAIDSGAAYVFVRNGTTWSQQAYLKASNTGAGDRFASVRLSADGSTLAVSAALEDSAATGINGDQADNSAPDSGAVYMFVRSGTTWSQQAYLKASNTGAEDLFGIIALSGDGQTLAVGAYQEDAKATGVGGDQSNDAAPYSGAVYVFDRSGATWSQQAYIKASNNGLYDAFGNSVRLSTDGSILVVGAYRESGAAHGVGGNQDDDSADSAGAVYRFTRTGTRWSQQAYIKASNSEADDLFGFNLALSGDGSTLAVSAIGEDSETTGVNGDQTNNYSDATGAVYVFR